MKKALFFALVILLMLAGCAGDAQSDIFALPEMPETHSALLQTVEEVRLGGFEYAEPKSGFSRHPIQLVDLDGDGENEGIVFLRDITETYKTYIYIFEQSDSVFGLFDIIEGSENEIYTVSYSALLENGGYELIVKWGADDEGSHSVTAYTLTQDGVQKNLSIMAEQFSVSDIDGDGQNELLAVRKSDGQYFADIYAADADEIEKKASIRLSEHKDGKVIRILSGKISDEKNAAFIERRSDDGIITDVVSGKDGFFENVIPSGDVCGVSALCADVNNDGITELPQETEKNDLSDTDRTYVWRRVSGEGILIPTTFTYHSFSDNWYLSLPLEWQSSVFAEKKKIGSERVRIDFFSKEMIDADEDTYIKAPLFSIYVLTGSNRKNIATEDGEFIISERENMLIAGKITSEGYLGEKIDEDFIKKAFKNRESDWASEILFA